VLADEPTGNLDSTTSADLVIAGVDQVISSVRAAARGESVLEPRIAARLVREVREVAVLRLLHTLLYEVQAASTKPPDSVRHRLGMGRVPCLAGPAGRGAAPWRSRRRSVPAHRRRMGR
jgi:hypothetical protein